MKGRVAVITGASRGIGLEIARVLAREGCRLALLARSREALEKVAEALASEDVDCCPLAADVSNQEQVKAAFQALLDRWGKVDFLVNNAGITRDGLVLRMKREDWDTVLQVNLTGVFECTREALHSMVRNRFGRIINVTSVVAQMGNKGQANYIASKAGIIGFTRAVAREVASRNITVNAVAPGFIDTEMTQAINEQARDTLLQMIPLGRMGTAADVAAAVRFLLSEDAGYITGHVLNVNGGMYMGA
ncbi:MAG TPA: 3-oxoacyl-[acyl-carrier-protein] reductase [Acidobacteriota bacterium]|nr:3-oxoacyl-[acyl-carrier-protein] reductase [Acidobacteriota bacterium]